MSTTDSRIRIWDKMIDSERMSRYYARRADTLNRSHMWWSFGIYALTILAVACYQLDQLGKSSPLVAFGLLLAASLSQAYLLHYAPSTSGKAATVMSLQSGKLAEQWRKLWIGFENQDRQDVDLWIEFLEDQTKHVTTTTVPYDECTNQQCNREARHEINRQFGQTE